MKANTNITYHANQQQTNLQYTAPAPIRAATLDAFQASAKKSHNTFAISAVNNQIPADVALCTLVCTDNTIADKAIKVNVTSDGATHITVPQHLEHLITNPMKEKISLIVSQHITGALRNKSVEIVFQVDNNGVITCSSRELNTTECNSICNYIQTHKHKLSKDELNNLRFALALTDCKDALIISKADINTQLSNSPVRCEYALSEICNIIDKKNGFQKYKGCVYALAECLVNTNTHNKQIVDDIANAICFLLKDESISIDVKLLKNNIISELSRLSRLIINHITALGDTVVDINNTIKMIRNSTETNRPICKILVRYKQDKIIKPSHQIHIPLVGNIDNEYNENNKIVLLHHFLINKKEYECIILINNLNIPDHEAEVIARVLLKLYKHSMYRACNQLISQISKNSRSTIITMLLKDEYHMSYLHWLFINNDYHQLLAIMEILAVKEYIKTHNKYLVNLAIKFNSSSALTLIPGYLDIVKDTEFLIELAISRKMPFIYDIVNDNLYIHMNNDTFKTSIGRNLVYLFISAGDLIQAKLLINKGISTISPSGEHCIMGLVGCNLTHKNKEEIKIISDIILDFENKICNIDILINLLENCLQYHNFILYDQLKNQLLDKYSEAFMIDKLTKFAIDHYVPLQVIKQRFGDVSLYSLIQAIQAGYSDNEIINNIPKVLLQQIALFALRSYKDSLFNSCIQRLSLEEIRSLIESVLQCNNAFSGIQSILKKITDNQTAVNNIKDTRETIMSLRKQLLICYREKLLFIDKNESYTNTNDIPYTFNDFMGDESLISSVIPFKHIVQFLLAALLFPDIASKDYSVFNNLNATFPHDQQRAHSRIVFASLDGKTRNANGFTSNAIDGRQVIDALENKTTNITDWLQWALILLMLDIESTLFRQIVNAPNRLFIIQQLLTAIKNTKDGSTEVDYPDYRKSILKEYFPTPLLEHNNNEYLKSILSNLSDREIEALFSPHNDVFNDALSISRLDSIIHAAMLNKTSSLFIIKILLNYAFMSFLSNNNNHKLNNIWLLDAVINYHISPQNNHEHLIAFLTSNNLTIDQLLGSCLDIIKKALFSAIEFNNVEVLKLIVEGLRFPINNIKNNNIKKNGLSPILFAIKFNSADVAEYIINNDHKINISEIPDNNNALCCYREDRCPTKDKLENKLNDAIKSCNTDRIADLLSIMIKQKALEANDVLDVLIQCWLLKSDLTKFRTSVLTVITVLKDIMVANDFIAYLYESCKTTSSMTGILSIHKFTAIILDNTFITILFAVFQEVCKELADMFMNTSKACVNDCIIAENLVAFKSINFVAMTPKNRITALSIIIDHQTDNTRVAHDMIKVMAAIPNILNNAFKEDNLQCINALIALNHDPYSLTYHTLTTANTWMKRESDKLSTAICTCTVKDKPANIDDKHHHIIIIAYLLKQGAQTSTIRFAIFKMLTIRGPSRTNLLNAIDKLAINNEVHRIMLMTYRKTPLVQGMLTIVPQKSPPIISCGAFA